MKKRIIVLLILTIVLMPNLVKAATCTGTVITGNADSFALPSNNMSGTCESATCLWGWNSIYADYRGLRIQIYKYNGTNINLVGEGVDIWVTQKLKDSSYHFSSPNTKNLINKASCDRNTNPNISSARKDFDRVYGYTWQQYLSGNAGGTVIYDPSLGSNGFKINDVPSFLLKYEPNSNNPTNSWIYNNILEKVMDGSSAKLNEVKTLFKLSDTELNRILSNPDDYYITAEVLYKIKRSNGEYYLGTVSEGGYFYGYSELYNVLQSSGGNVGKLVSTRIRGTYKIKQIARQVPRPSYSGIGGTSYNLDAACNAAYGYAVYHLASICENCTKSCENECSGKTETERRACAIKYCQENESGNYSSCVSKCSATNLTEGCPAATKGKCKKNYTAASESDTCNVSVTKSEELTSNTCYDDSSTIDDVVAEDYQQLQIKYYKIDCSEKLNLFSLPSQQQILISKNSTANLSIGYGATYTKDCKVWYKNLDGTSWISEDNKAESNYRNSDMLIKHDIYIYKKYRNDAPAGSDLYKIYDEAYKQLKNSYALSKTRLEKVSTDDYSNDVSSVSAKVDIVDQSLSNTEETTITLEPVYCEQGSSTVGTGSASSSRNAKCILNKYEVNYDDDTGRVVCGNDGEAKATINAARGTSEYKYTVYYAPTSSWVSSFSSNPGSIFHTKSECLDAVEESNGQCIEKENVWVFDPFTESINRGHGVSQVTSGDYTISIKNFGSCGQFDYEYKCKYNLEDSGLCTDECIAKYNNHQITRAEYNTCFKKYCSCDSYCGSNVACRAKYCPQECEGCDKTWNETDEDEVCDDCVNKCNDNYSSSSKENINCKYDCCQTECNGGEGCIYNCCTTKCKKKYDLGLFAQEGVSNQTGYDNCMLQCECPNGNCGGEDYYYRTIDLDTPFPGGTGLTRKPGANWYNKTKYITDTTNPSTIFYDDTDGRRKDYEYKITLTSEDIKRIKSDRNINTTYEDFNKSESAKNGNVYCSYIIHDYFEANNIEVEAGVSGVLGSGCK